MRKRSAMTLVEVLASLFILGSAATSILVAQGRALEQVRTAELEIEASELAHELMSDWRLTDAKVADAAAGRFESKPAWTWRRWSEQRAIAENFTAIEVVLEIASERDNGRPPWTRQFAWLERAQ